MNNMRRRHKCVLIALTFGAIAWFFIMKGGNGFMRTATHPEPTGKQIREINNFKHLKHQMDYDYDFALAKERGICSKDDGPDASYLKLQRKYDRALSLYLKQTLDIEGLDAKLAAKGIPGYDVQTGDAADTIWKWFRSRSHLSSPYLYLRSNLRIERLSLKDIATLRSRSLDNEAGRQELAALAKRTYRELTRYEGEYGVWDKDRKSHEVLYCDLGSHDPDGPTNDRAPAECLVLWLTFEDERLDDESRSVKERNKIYERDDTSWHFYIQDGIIPAYERKFSEELGYPVRIFLHDNP